MTAGCFLMKQRDEQWSWDGGNRGGAVGLAVEAKI